MKTTLLCVLALSFLSLSANDDDLGGSSHREEMERQGKRLQALDDKLNRTYKLAPAATPEKDQTDNRRDREQLRKPQPAWLMYVREQCALEGGQQGGSNSYLYRSPGSLRAPTKRS